MGWTDVRGTLCSWLLWLVFVAAMVGFLMQIGRIAGKWRVEGFDPDDAKRLLWPLVAMVVAQATIEIVNKLFPS